MNASWYRVEVEPSSCAALRQAMDEGPLPPGAAAFALRRDGGQVVFLTTPARPVADALGLTGVWAPCGPPEDDERLRLLGGDRAAWADVVRPRA